MAEVQCDEANPVTGDLRLARVTEICLALPEVTRGHMGDYARFEVRGKRFAYYLDDHHGDGITAIACKVAAGMNRVLVAAEPEKYYLPAYLGANGWVGLRLDVGEIDWDEVGELITDSYLLLAPKKLAATVQTPSD